MTETAHPVEFAGHRIGLNERCFIIAEAGVNHDGDLERAFALVDVAAAAGADAVKFQTFSADRLVTREAPKAPYQADATGGQESQYAMLQKLELSCDQFAQLSRYCASKGILFLSTPFDEQSANFLNELGMAAIKVPSGEITNLPFLAHLAAFEKPLLMSTGMADLGEVEQAVRTVSARGEDKLVLLHCVSSYPAAPTDVNLRAIHTMSSAFRVPVGYSDHTLGLPVCMAAVALGACLIEKHFTLSRDLPGPDHCLSLEPGELIQLIRGIRDIENAMGDGRKRPAASETSVAQVARKSVVAAIDIAKGTPITMGMLAIKRPGTGILPANVGQVAGRSARHTIRAGQPITWDLLT